MVTAQLGTLEASLSKELQSVLARIQKAETLQPSLSNQPSFADDAAAPPTPVGRTDYRRRWTCAVDGADTLSDILRRNVNLDEEDPDDDHKPAGARSSFSSASPMRLDAQVSPRSPMTSPRSNTTTRSSEPPRKSISFEGKNDDSDDSDKSEDEQKKDLADEPGSTSVKSGSSVGWRIDALDCGDRLASSAAAKKGSATVDSIVELVESERNLWAEEKLALEARLEELKEQAQQMRRRGPDAEKAELKRKVQELRETMKLRSRFGAWVCERHMQESDDEEETASNIEREELRETMMMLRAELRKAKAQAPQTSPG